MSGEGRGRGARHDIARNFKSIAELFKLRRSGACNFSAGSWYDPELSLYSPVILVKKEKNPLPFIENFSGLPEKYSKRGAELLGVADSSEMRCKDVQVWGKTAAVFKSKTPILYMQKMCMCRERTGLEEDQVAEGLKDDGQAQRQPDEGEFPAPALPPLGEGDAGDHGCGDAQQRGNAGP